MIKDLERVALTEAVPAAGLERGGVGTIVHANRDSEAFEVEFTALGGHAAAVVMADVSPLRPVGGHETTHARGLSAR